MTPKKAMTWVGVAFVVFFILSSPHDSAGVIRSAWDGIESIERQLSAFSRGIA